MCSYHNPPEAMTCDDCCALRDAYDSVETPPRPSYHASCGDGENAAMDHKEVNSSTFLKRGMQFISTRIHAFFAGSESEQHDECKFQFNYCGIIILTFVYITALTTSHHCSRCAYRGRV